VPDSPAVAHFTAPDGVRLAYEVVGEGPAVLLLHGFASSARINWVRPGVAGALADGGFQVLSYDARGHGGSDAPHQPAAYGADAMVDDARALADHLGLERFDAVGYSMGAQTAAALAEADPRVRRVVLGGIGSRLLALRPGEEPYPAAAIADALEADDPWALPEGTGRAFRAFADATGSDRLALAALQRARTLDGRADLSRITVPVLVVVGRHDTLVGDASSLVDGLADARLEVVPGDHLSAVTTPAFAAAVVRFLAAP